MIDILIIVRYIYLTIKLSFNGGILYEEKFSIHIS